MRHPTEISDDKVRRWLTSLRRPDQLVAPEVSELLRSHGRQTDGLTGIELGRAAATLLVEAIERLKPQHDAPREQTLPYLVLKTCFLDGAKLFQAAAKLGMSERQLSRERARAIRLLRSELEAPPLKSSRFWPEPIPAILGFVPRPALTRSLREALSDRRFVHVHGPVGVGKTSLVAELATEAASHQSVFWFRIRPGVSDSLAALLFDLGEYLRDRGELELAAFIEQSLPHPDMALAARVALKGLATASQLIVLDDYHFADEDKAITGLLEDGIARLPELKVITVSRHRNLARDAAVSFPIPPLTRAETRMILTTFGVEVTPQMSQTLHEWTGGIPQLIKLAASWLRTSTPEQVARGTKSLRDIDEVQAFLLDGITELIEPRDRSVLEAASVFRDRFTDDALGFVAGLTRGEVQDASVRLVRSYIATRGRSGDVAFFHATVRDYVYERLDAVKRAEFHARAAEWYDDMGDVAESAYHRTATTRDRSSSSGRRARPNR